MSPTITVRDIDPGDKFWLKHEARQVGVSSAKSAGQRIAEIGRSGYVGLEFAF